MIKLLTQHPWTLPLLFFILALVLRVHTIGDTPLHPDELHYAYDFLAAEETNSVAAIRDIKCAFLVERRTAHPMSVALLTRWLWLPFDMHNLTPGFLRGFNAFAGALITVVAWFVGSTVSGRRHACIAAFFVAVAPGMVWISRTLWLDAPFTLLIALMVLCAALSMKRSGLLFPLLQGVCFGLALSTKISAPILVPALLAGALLAPRATPWRERLLRTATAIAVALTIFVLFCDPASYIEVITQPTDPRYTAAWEDGGVPSYMNRLFVTAKDLAQITLWELPLTSLLLALVALVESVRQRDGFRLYLLVMLLSLTPLLFMHMAPLSGPHGLMPIYLIVTLLASYVFAMPPKQLLVMVSLHAVLALTSITLRTLESIPWFNEGMIYPRRSLQYELVSPWLTDQSPVHSIVILDEFTASSAWNTLLRMSQLTEGAIFFAPAPAAPEVTSEMWQWAHVVIAAPDTRIPEPVPDHFREGPVDGSGYRVFVNEAQRPRRSVEVAKLAPVGDGMYLLPGGVYPLTGHVLLDGNELPNDAATGNTFFGPVDHSGRGTGLLRLDDEARDGAISIEPPRRDDVFWDF